MPGDQQRSGRLLLLALSLTVASACGADSGVRARRSDDSTIPATSTTEVVPTSTTTTSTTLPPVTLPSTTLPPTTVAAPPTAPPPTEAPTTTIGGVAAGWSEGAVPADILDGCCEFLWTGTPSPAFPDDPAAPLPDGLYSAWVAVPWSAAQPNQLTIEVSRIERCNIIGDASCEYGGPYGDTDVGTSLEPVRAYTVTLDENVAVTLGGFDLCASVVKHGNGDDIVSVLQAFDTAYTSVIGGPLNAGTSEDDIVAAIAAGPAQGFAISDPNCMAGLLEFRTGTAPALLLQVLTGYNDDGSRPLLTPTDLIRLVAIDQHDGLTTLGFYAGFYS